MTTALLSCKDRLQAYLRQQGVSFVLRHEPMAAAADGSAETVVVVADGRMCMLVLPASRLVQHSRAKEELHAHEVHFASEVELAGAFSDCDFGAQPALGNLYGVSVYVDRSLASDEAIVFRAGTLTDTICMKYADFVRLVHPVELDFARPRQIRTAVMAGVNS